VPLNLHSFRHAALWGWHQLLTLALALLVVVAVVVGLGRQFTPAISDYRAAIESRLSSAIGVPVHIERLTGSWAGMTPFFLIESFQLRDPAHPDVTLLQIPRMELRPSLWRSLLALEPRVDLRIRGLDIHLEQLPDGRVRMRELASLAQSDPAAARRAIELALRQPLLAIEDGRLELALQGFPVLQLHHLSLASRNNGSQHRLAGEVHLDSVPQPVAVNMTLEGDPVDWRKGRLSIWMGLPSLKLDAWLPKANVAGIGLQEVQGGGEFWLHFVQGQLMAVQSRPSLQRAVFSSSLGAHVLQNVHGEMGWTRAAGEWHLSAQHLTARLDNVAWPVPTLALHGKERHLSVAASGIDMGAAALLANRLPLPDALAEWLREATPAGQTSVGVELEQGEQDQWQTQQVTARFSQLGVHATTRFPGGSNLAGWAYWTPSMSLLGLDVKNGQLDLRQVFREPVAVDQLQGIVRLRAETDGWQIESDSLKVKNPDARGHALLRLDIPRDTRISPHLSLLARLTDAKVASVWRYVPWQPAGDGALAWLRHALVAGTVTQGDFLVEGLIHHEKEDEHSLRQLMRFELKEAGLDYSLGWPALSALDGVVTIDGRHLRVEASRARLLDGTVAHDVRADIPDLRQARLAVSGEVQSTGPDLMRLFRESPLRTHTASVAEAIQLEGGLSGHLVLDIPVSHHLPPATHVEVTTQLTGNRLVLPKQGLVADGLQGQVRFSTREGLIAESLQGRLLGAPVQARISSTVRGDTLQLVQVDLDGLVTATSLRNWLGGPLWDAFKGESRYQARIRIPSGPQPGQLLVTSGLAGMSILLPTPLAKGVEPLALRYQSSLGGTQQLARLQLGKQLNAGLVWREEGLHAALLRLDSTDTGWPSKPGIEIEGRVPLLVWADWEPWVDKFSQDGVASAKRSTMPGLTRLDVSARELDAKGWRIRDVKIQVAREAAGWRMGLENNEIAGSLLWPDADAQELAIEVDRLTWPLMAMPEANVADGVVSGQSIRRPVRIGVERLQLRNYPEFGSISGQARLLPSPYGVRVDGLKLVTPIASFDGRLDWQWRGGDSTRLRGVARCDDAADLLKALRFAPTLQSGQARAEVDLSWPSTPQALTLSKLDGSLSLAIDKGRLLNVNTGTSASRVFGLVDLDNLRRRFKGDFSDVLKRGLSFDSVTLSGDVQSGVMPKAVFELEGPSLSAHGEGRLDLAGQQIDQIFTVNVPVSSAVPLAAAVMAGPLVGGAVAAAEMILKKQIQRATVLHYHISGDWDDPEVDRVSPPPRAGNAMPRPQGGRP